MRPVQVLLNFRDGRFLRIDSGERQVVPVHADRAAPMRSPIVLATLSIAVERAEVRQLGACRRRHTASTTPDMVDDLALAIVRRRASSLDDQIEITGCPPHRTECASHDTEDEWFRSFGETWGGVGTAIAKASD